MKETGKCRLCLQEKQLRKSHVIPEFFYKDLYDDKHKFFRLSNDPKKVENTKFKGIHERLLCGDCEKLLNESYEQYVHDVLRNRIKIKRTQTPDTIILEGLDYARFKLFLISILWRCHVAEGSEFSQVNLGSIHGERLRKMIVDNEPGFSYEYGCLVFFSRKMTAVLNELIYPPEPMVFREFGVYRAVFGGLFWAYIISDRPNTFPYKQFFISEDGKMIIRRNDKFSTEFLQGIAADFQKARKSRGTA